MNGMIAEEKSLARLDRFWRAKLHLHSETPTLHGTMKMRSYVQERFLDPFRFDESMEYSYTALPGPGRGSKSLRSGERKKSSAGSKSCESKRKSCESKRRLA